VTTPNYGRLRLFHLREQTEAMQEQMDYERGRYDRLRSDDAKPRAVSSFNLFQTPEPLALRAAEMLGDLPEGARILEPSAGLGRLYRAARARFPGATISLVENSPDCCAELYREIEGAGSVGLYQRDFLGWSPPWLFDAVLMNPPFQRGRDIVHTRHALGMLKPGGVLVGFCYAGNRQAAALEPLAEVWEPLGPGAFKSEGTNAGAVLFRIRT